MGTRQQDQRSSVWQHQLDAETGNGTIQVWRKSRDLDASDARRRFHPIDFKKLRTSTMGDHSMIVGNLFIGLLLLIKHAISNRATIIQAFVLACRFIARWVCTTVVWLFGTGIMLWMFVCASALLAVVVAAAFPFAIALIAIFAFLAWRAKARPGSNGRSGGGQT